MNFEIILRDFLVDILRGRAKNSRSLSWLRFPTPRAKARFSASSFCALTSRTAGHLLRLLAKPRFLIERCSIGWSAIGLPGWPRSRVSRGSTAGNAGNRPPRFPRSLRASAVIFLGGGRPLKAIQWQRSWHAFCQGVDSEKKHLDNDNCRS